MDAFDDAIQRLQRDLDNLRQVRPQRFRDGTGDAGLSPQIKDPDGGGNGGPEPPEPPPPPSNPNLRIAGIEATQAIQYFNLTGQGTGIAPDNSIMPLVGGKTTVLRVYMDVSTQDSRWPLPSTVTGELKAYPLFQVSDPASTPINGPIAARTLTTTNRGNANDTLNFLMQGWQCTGAFQPIVRLFDPNHRGDPLFTGPWYDAPQITVTEPSIDLSMHVFVVRIIYTGPDANGRPTRLGPPSEQDMVNTLSNSFVSRTYPISGINYTGSIIAEFGGDLRRDGSGSCGAGWEALLDMLRTLRPAPSDGVNRDVVLGLLPGGVAAQQIPRNKFTGCGGYDGVAVTFAGYDYDRAVAHELGHAYGRMHAPCANPDTNNVDPMYPTYGGTFPAGSIGEWGFGTTFSTLINPATIFDFMSYCHDQWISPYTYVGLFLSILFRNIGWGLSPSAGAPAALLEASEERDYLCLNFRMYRDGRVEVLPSFHLSGVGPVPGSEDGPQPPVVFELRDAEERVIGFHRCHFTDPNSDPDSPYRAFHEVIPWESETRSIRFLRDGEEVDKVDVEERAPELTSQAVTELEDPGNRRRLEWEGNHDTESLTYLVRYSNDGGENWLGLAAGLTEPRFVADLDCLPGGETCVFQIVASSTIRTTVAETDPVPVPIKPRRPFIVSPEPDASFLQGESVVLAGLGYSPDFGTAPLDEVVWTSNVAGFIGYGYEVITQTLTPGLHKITLGVTDGIGAEASEDVLIRINPKEE